MHRRLAVPMLPLRVWVHCPRASNGLLPPRSYPVGYMRWYAWSDSGFVPPSSFRQSFQQLSVRRSANLTLPDHGRITRRTGGTSVGFRLMPMANGFVAFGELEASGEFKFSGS